MKKTKKKEFTDRFEVQEVPVSKSKKLSLKNEKRMLETFLNQIKQKKNKLTGQFRSPTDRIILKNKEKRNVRNVPKPNQTKKTNLPANFEVQEVGP
jgi:hypothetical protein